MNVKSQYQYGILEPIVTMHNKHGQAFCGTMSQLLDEMEKNPKDWNYSAFDLVMPAICMAMGIMLLFFIIFSSVK